MQAATNPTDNILAHNFGVAVVKEAVQKRNPLPTERLQVCRAHAPPQTKRSEKQPPDLPKCWASVVSGKASTPTAGSQTRTTADGSVCAAVASRARDSVAAPAAAPTTTPTSDAASQPQPAAAMSPADLATMMAAAIESALKPMKEQLEATIIPMQRTIESLQAEFVAMREDAAAGDDAMLDATASETALATRVDDTERVQTRATTLKMSGVGL